MEFADSKKIIKTYEKLGLTPQIITELIENGSVGNSDHVIVNILRARQLTEAMKVPDLVTYAQDLEEQGNSVVLFVNFRDTVVTLCDQLKCKAIEGGQTVEERQAIVDEFQNDESTIVVANIAAGGTGLSLHDCNGDRPRVSLICPSFNAKDYLQTLGRIHRNGAKSDAIQKVLVTSGSIEENVIDSIERKINNLTELHGI
jgi:SNF2 family DNA or RNA helicase